MRVRLNKTGAVAALVLLLGQVLAQAAAAGPPRLAQPLDCELGKTCYIQNYVDDDPGPGAVDFRCHGLTYDGHKGTDFALPDLAAMEAGVTVTASAPGRVLALRDGEPDGAYLKDRNSTQGRECGNGVVIDHGDGWQTQYCHLQRGSVTVKKGQPVDTGTALGRVGLSGMSEFPHVHIAVRHNGAVVDPFDPEGTATCATAPVATLWVDPPAYRPGGLLAAGFIGGVPDFGQIKAGRAGHATLPPDAPALVLWGYGFGVRKGDHITLSISGPEGFRQRTTVTMDRSRALFSQHMGKRHRVDWPRGIYHGSVALIRDGTEISRQETTLTISE